MWCTVQSPPPGSGALRIVLEKCLWGAKFSTNKGNKRLICWQYILRIVFTFQHNHNIRKHPHPGPSAADYSIIFTSVLVRRKWKAYMRHKVVPVTRHKPQVIRIRQHKDCYVRDFSVMYIAVTTCAVSSDSINHGAPTKV